MFLVGFSGGVNVSKRMRWDCSRALVLAKVLVGDFWDFTAVWVSRSGGLGRLFVGF